MKKAILVEYNLMTRIVIDEQDENLETIVEKSKPKILDKINNDELRYNLCEWYDDTEMPYSEEEEHEQVEQVANNYTKFARMKHEIGTPLLSLGSAVNNIQTRLEEMGIDLEQTRIHKDFTMTIDETLKGMLYSLKSISESLDKLEEEL